MSPPAVTVGEAAVLVTETSATPSEPAGPTEEVAMAVLLAGFRSAVVLVTRAVFATGVPVGVPAGTLTTSVYVAVAPGARVARVLVMGPVPPTAGVVLLAPAGPVNEANVVPTGTTSL